MMVGLTEKREFEGGAFRDTEAGKLDYEAFYSPLVFKAYAEYLNKHRDMPDGTRRAGDNWQNGIPLDVYMKSMMRHVVDVWMHHRGYPELATEPLDDALGGVLFNAMGYWFETLTDEAADAEELGSVSMGNIDADATPWWRNYPAPPSVQFDESKFQESLKKLHASVGDMEAQYTVEGYDAALHAPFDKVILGTPIKVGDSVVRTWAPWGQPAKVLSIVGDTAFLSNEEPSLATIVPVAELQHAIVI